MLKFSMIASLGENNKENEETCLFIFFVYSIRLTIRLTIMLNFIISKVAYWKQWLYAQFGGQVKCVIDIAKMANRFIFCADKYQPIRAEDNVVSSKWQMGSAKDVEDN